MSEIAGTHRRMQVVTVGEALASFDGQLRDRNAGDVGTLPTPYGVLNDLLGGGLHAGDLVLLGGPPGVGKTITALQWARHLAINGSRAVFACYEHEPTTLLVRLLALEIGELGGDERLARGLTRLLASGAQQSTGIDEVLLDHPIGAAALERLREYADRLILVRASGSHTTVDDIAALPELDGAQPGQTVLFVDYLQKIPLHPEPEVESEKVTRTVEALKDVALSQHLPVVLLSAVDAEGMRVSRPRLHHLRGSSAIAFESDVVVMMTSKEKAVSKVHLSYDATRARTFRNWVVFSIEKNRGGPNLVDLEFEKDFAHFRFDPNGGIVSERLVDERLDEDDL